MRIECSGLLARAGEEGMYRRAGSWMSAKYCARKCAAVSLLSTEVGGRALRQVLIAIEYGLAGLTEQPLLLPVKISWGFGSASGCVSIGHHESRRMLPKSRGVNGDRNDNAE